MSVLYNIVSIITGIIIITGLFSLGWIGNMLYQHYDYQRQVDGFYAENMNQTRLNEVKDIKDSKGDWVCLNVRDMPLERAYETCSHECLHLSYSEIIAEKCEKDFENCAIIVDKFWRDKE